MGAKLVAYYEQISKELGSAGRMKLAMLTLVPSTKADAEPDSPENLKKFEQALATVRQGSKAG